eukprot:CAMPEP_0182596032 /NCGR_PEP_ID=MMETSP1324-20130603/83460_1 /TAXON_ID=236786 /ORGANISM="Florenciella sp., Strain RCC1587" /LENGTH=104 /DNA_ID=CAMNT_0024813677 /DNA_START=1 /DNA_END=311 /DNA_ORIENTATION=+
MCLAAFFASASFAHDGGAAAVVITFVISITVNILLADADLEKQKIRSKGSGAIKHIVMLLGVSAFTALLTFGYFPRSVNVEFHFHFINNHGTVETISMFTRFMA